MFTFRRPTDDDIRKLLARQPGQPWTYEPVEVTRHGAPEPRPGWQIDHHRVPLGHGERVFAAACEAIRAWQMFPPEMTRVHWLDAKGSGVFGGTIRSMMEGATPPKTPDRLTAPQQVGDVVAVLYRARPFLLWMLFPARVVYRVDEPRRYGFAYGTLPDHPERGEERFLVEWNQADDSVWYDLLAVSRPGHWLARLGYLYARYEQSKFRRLSGQAMLRAVRGRESLAGDRDP